MWGRTRSKRGLGGGRVGRLENTTCLMSTPRSSPASLDLPLMPLPPALSPCPPPCPLPLPPPLLPPPAPPPAPPPHTLLPI